MLGILATMSIMSRMTTDGSVSASSSSTHQKKVKVKSSESELNNLIETDERAAANAQQSVKANEDVEGWANEAMSAFSTLKETVTETNIKIPPTELAKASSLDEEPEVFHTSPKLDIFNFDKTKNKIKAPASPLEDLMREIRFVPDELNLRTKGRKRDESLKAERFSAHAVPGTLRTGSSAPVLKSASKDNVINKDYTIVESTRPDAVGKLPSWSINYDKKTDNRGRDPNDDIIIMEPASMSNKEVVSNSVAEQVKAALTNNREETRVTKESSALAFQKRAPDVRGSATSTALVKYHDQARLPPPAVVIHSVDSLKAEGRSVPNMQFQKAKFEEENLKLHLCNGVFEAYSASYLTTKKHMIDVKSEGYNLTWVNCEMASFIHMRESKNFFNNAMGEGMIMQSLDVLDFSVIHLSAFERSSKKHKNLLWTKKEDLRTAWHNIDPVKNTARILDNMNNPKNPLHRNIIYSKEAMKTVVIMPFLGGAMGAGHSELGNRFEYLKACFWSFYEFIPNIVAGVTRKEDVDWCMKQSGMPFYDVILMENLPKSASLPVATTQQVKKRLVSGVWDFDYVFFTESDQILISRELQLMYDHLKKYPDRMMLPHRLMPYSDRVVKEVHKRNINDITGTPSTFIQMEISKGYAVGPNDWMTQSCCLERQNCVDRKSWKSISAPEVPIINYHGLFVPLGNVNFLAESYRYCKLSAYTNICP